MARFAFAALLLVLMAVPAAGVDFEIDVAGESADAVFNTNNFTEGDVHEFNASLENPSSVGCEYFLRGEFERGNRTERRYSSGYRLWPGEVAKAEINYVPVNYSGSVDADIDLIYCDTVRNISDYSFDISNPDFNRSFDAETLKVTESSVKANLSARNGTLVPVKTPPYWRVGSTEFSGYTAEVEYAPTLFQEKELAFAVVQDNRVKGKVSVQLTSPPPALKEKLWDKRFEIASAAAAILFFSNLFLLRRKILPDKVLKKLGELEPDRSIKN